MEPTLSSLRPSHQNSLSRSRELGVRVDSLICVDLADMSPVAPFGRFLPIRADVLKGSLSETEGGTGTAEKFWAWSEEQTKPYL
jgi:hypothetical protein